MSTPSRQFLSFVLAAVSMLLTTNKVIASSPRECEQQLESGGSVEMLRYFRATDANITASGIYRISPGKQTIGYYPFAEPGQGLEPVVTSLGRASFSSHQEILRRLMGTARYQAYVNNQDPALIDAALDQELERTQGPEVKLDAEDVMAKIASVPVKAPLTPELEDLVFRLFRQMGRLATPMTDWLRPKLLAGTIEQLPANLFEHSISSEIRDGVFVYKAIFFRVNLNGVKEFILSGGGNGIPDRVHDLVYRALGLAIPAQRIVEAKSGYLVITFDKPDERKSGSILFVNKNSRHEILAREHFNFPDIP